MVGAIDLGDCLVNGIVEANIFGGNLLKKLSGRLIRGAVCQFDVSGQLIQQTRRSWTDNL